MLLLVLDWDETLTTKDTLSLIAPSSPPTPSSSLPSSPRFSTLSKFYMEDLSSHTNQLEAATTLEDQLRYLNSIDKVELQSQERVERSGIFRDFDPKMLEKRAESTELKFRDGWSSSSSTTTESSASQWIQKKSKSNSLELHIISVGWSARFIRLGLSSKKGGSFPQDIPKTIIANEIQIGKDGKGTGKMTKSNDVEFERFERLDLGEEEKDQDSLLEDHKKTNFSGIRTGIHKLREFKRLREQKLIDLKEKKFITVYVGDSNTDLPCLLASDVGIIIGESNSLIQTIERLDFKTFLSIGFEEWKLKRSKESNTNLSKSMAIPKEKRVEKGTGEEIWKEILIKEGKSRKNEEGSFDLVKVKDWIEALQVLKVLEDERNDF